MIDRLLSLCLPRFLSATVRLIGLAAVASVAASCGDLIAAPPNFLFCYSPNFAKEPTKVTALVYAVSSHEEEAAFRRSCEARGQAFLTSDVAHCWVTASLLDKMETGEWDREKPTHRCYFTPAFCKSQRADLIDHWTDKGSPPPLVSDCLPTPATSRFLNFTQELAGR